MYASVHEETIKCVHTHSCPVLPRSASHIHTYTLLCNCYLLGLSHWSGGCFWSSPPSPRGGQSLDAEALKANASGHLIPDCPLEVPASSAAAGVGQDQI